MESFETGDSRRQEEHVSFKQSLSTVLVEDGTTVNLRAELKAMRLGMLALMSPVMTFTEGCHVATMRWIPAARAF